MNQLKILVVDDKKVIGDLFDFTLGYSGHLLKIVNNAKDALDAIRNNQYDIAFIDIVMPGVDGVQLLEDIKRVEPKLPVVMMSGYSVEDKKKRAEELGAVTCLKKPFEIDDVRQIIKVSTGKDI